MLYLDNRIRQALGKRRSPLTIQYYSQLARRFSRFTGKTDNFTRQDVLNYIDFLIENKYSDASITWTYSVLRKVFRILNLEFDVTPDDLPVLNKQPKIQPVISPDDVKKIILATKKHGTPLERFYLALSTVFGLRREELVNLDKTCFTPTVSHVEIKTLKHGTPRTHVIPEQVRPDIRLVVDHVHIPKISTATMSKIYQDISQKSGHRRQPREGWHSIRRSLNTELLARNVPYYIVRDFLRWKSRSGDMPGQYFHMHASAVDKRVYQDHPFLGFWNDRS